MSAASIVESVLVKGTARIAMILAPIVLAAFGWIIITYIGNQAAEISDLGDSFHRLDSRVTAIEASSLRGRADRDFQFQQMLGRLDKFDDRFDIISTQLATVTAKMDTLVDQKHAEIVPPGMR